MEAKLSMTVPEIQRAEALAAFKTLQVHCDALTDGEVLDLRERLHRTAQRRAHKQSEEALGVILANLPTLLPTHLERLQDHLGWNKRDNE